MPQLTPEQIQALAIDPVTGRAPKRSPLQTMNQTASMVDQAQQAKPMDNSAPAAPTGQEQPISNAPAQDSSVAGGNGQPPTSRVSDYGQPALETVWNQMAPKPSPDNVGQKYPATE